MRNPTRCGEVLRQPVVAHPQEDAELICRRVTAVRGGLHVAGVWMCYNTAINQLNKVLATDLPRRPNRLGEVTSSRGTGNPNVI
jgi:hypothetical protein